MPTINIIKRVVCFLIGYWDSSQVASSTFEGFDVNYDPITVTLSTAFQNVDEVRFYISAIGIMP